MTKAKKNRSYITQTVVSKNGSWNSDFNHSPKQYEGTFFASDRALKYAVRHVMEATGKQVLIKKWIKNISESKNGKSELEVFSTKELKELFLKEFGKGFHEVFWDFEDVRHFGMVYDGLGIHGVAQISQGIDLYGQGKLYLDDLTGRMEFESKSKKDEKTRGMNSREFLSEAHFAYGISVNPSNVHFLQEISGYEHCVYTKEDYEILIEGLQFGPANVKSSQKMNCFTGFFLQIDLVGGEKTLLSNLEGKLRILPEKQEGKVIYDVSGIFEYLKKKEATAGIKIFEKIKLFYESSDIIIQGMDDSIKCEVIPTI